MKGYKTLIVNGAAVAIPLVDMAVNNGDIVSAVLGQHGAAAVSILGLINMVLRWVTTTPVLKQE